MRGKIVHIEQQKQHGHFGIQTLPISKFRLCPTLFEFEITVWSAFQIMASPELACVYAALILNDDGIEISSDKINSLLSAAGVKLESYWVDLFAEYFKSHDIAELIKGTSLGGAAPAAGGAAAGGAGATEEKKEEKKEEEEVVELAGGFDDLFG